MTCEFCGHEYPAGESCRCVKHKGRTAHNGPGDEMYQSRRNRREQEICNWALETGWEGDMEEWTALLNARAGKVCGPKGGK